MQAVTEIFLAYENSATKLGKATGIAAQTVEDWRRKSKPRIPPWRRATVLDAMRRDGKEISPKVYEYLSETRR